MSSGASRCANSRPSSRPTAGRERSPTTRSRPRRPPDAAQPLAAGSLGAAQRACETSCVTWVIAIAGFCALIVLHEIGHFLAAKAVGMRVERFSLFFPPKLVGFKRGETEYQIGALPLGGYVKITGMTPDELASVDLRVAER